MSISLDTNTVTIPAAAGGINGMAQLQMSGSFFYCKTATLNFIIQFGTSTKLPFDQGFKVKTPAAFSEIRFFNPNPYAVTVTFYVGDGSIDYVGTDNQKEAATYVFANGGNDGLITVPTAKKTGGANWLIVAPGAAVDLAVSNALAIPGRNNGQRRKLISFCNSALGNGQDVIILDANGKLFLRLTANDIPVAYESDATFYVCGVANALGVGGAATGFFYNEIYYAN